MNEAYLLEVQCAFELCKRTDAIESIPGHRRKLYHDDNCRQAQHRLLEARAQIATLRQLWMDYLPATQHLLEDVLARQGEAWVRSIVAAIAAERDQARHPSLLDEEQEALKHQWSDLQRGTQQILESLLNGGRSDPSILFHLILLAINEERRHAQCNSEQDQRAADLDIKVAAYRQIIDLDDRAKLVQQFLAVGQLLDYRAIPKFRIAAGLEAWEDYQSWTYEDTLAEVIVYVRELMAEEHATKELAENRSKVRQMERDLTTAQSEIHELRERMQQAQEASSSLQAIPTSALLVVQAYFHTHAGASLPLQRGSQTFQLTALRTDGVAAATGYGLVTLSAEELHSLARQTGTSILVPGPELEIEHVPEVDQERQVMQVRLSAIGERLNYRRLFSIPQVNAGIECWLQFVEDASYEQICQAVATAEHYYENLVYLDELEQQSRQAVQEKQQQKSRLRQDEQGQRTLKEKVMPLQAYLHTHIGHFIPLHRGKEQLAMKLLRDDGTGHASLQGQVSLTETDIEQMLQWVAEKSGTLTEVHPGREDNENQNLSQRVEELQRELSRYEPAPRALLECTLRQWARRTDLLYQDKKLAGEHLDAFLQEAGERKLINYVKQGESGYFFSKHRRRRIALIQQHLATAEPYQGDLALRMERIDDQGYVSFGNGAKQYLDTDGINHIWARITKERGQQTVGGNADLAPIQQYLCAHPGQPIEIRRGKNLYQLVVVDDDALAITENVGPIRLSEDDIDQAQCWIAVQL